MEVTSVEMERKGSFAHLEPSETYIKAFYKLKELEVALVSACLTADQVLIWNKSRFTPLHHSAYRLPRRVRDLTCGAR